MIFYLFIFISFLCVTACAAENGVWSSTEDTCTATHYLNGLCFKVSQPFGLSWEVDTT